MKVLRMLETMLIDECVVERVKARSAVRGSAAANVDTDGVSACGCSSELEVFPQPSCSSDTKAGHGLVARIGSQIIQEYSKDNRRASVQTLARRAKKLNRLVAKVKACDYESDSDCLYVAESISQNENLYSTDEINFFLDDRYGRSVVITDYFPDVKKFIKSVKTIQNWDFALLKNWRPLTLLCTNYKILSKGVI